MLSNDSSIQLPFTVESVAKVLAWGAAPDMAPHSHRQIAEWCDRFWCRHLDVDAPEEIERLLPILADVETQWDLYLANTYSLDELRTRSFENERMPTAWFEEWLKAACR
ncbi:hypothetical protein [Rhizobacter sp. SG703]|jgi:hypothetical protein|uniref:hypothetical protein n=1 Tax=Rhizobacter sp. SG703 TaxID=2587140 RepID=UPI0017A945C0|nr:hypothetical protein [Rhizobacter sp. SG703]NKI97841.1 hypothetical protein [Rhizobacter sp. SG703]